MKTKLTILLFSILLVMASASAQIPGAGWWVYDGDSLYAKIPDVWITGDSIHFAFAAFDSLSGINLDSLGRIQIDTLTVNDSLLVKKNLTVEDTTFCDYYMGLSPMHFLSPSYFGYLSADTIDAEYQVAPSFSGTDFSNIQGYWDIIAGPDSLEWSITDSIYATTGNVLDMIIDETDTMFVFFQETAGQSDYRLLKGTSLGWTSVGTIGTYGNCNAEKVSLCSGNGDTLYVAFANGYYAQCVAVWDGSSFSAIDTLDVISTTTAGFVTDIACESDGTLHVIGGLNASDLGYWTGTFGNWSATDTVTTAATISYGGAIVLVGSDPHIFSGSYAAGATEYYSPAGGWNSTVIDPSTNLIGDAAVSTGNVIYLACKIRTGTTRIYENRSGWAKVGSDLWSITGYYYPSICLNSLGSPAIAQTYTSLSVVEWTGAAWNDVSPVTEHTSSTIGLVYDSDDNIRLVARNNTNNYLLYGIKQSDPGQNTGHRNGALLIRANTKNDAGDIYIKTDSTIHIECDSLIIEGPTRVLDYALTTASKVTELVSGLSNTFFWSGTITHDSVTAAAVSEDVKLITAFPAKYKILEIFVDVTEVWDDAAGPISACDISVGWTGAAYDDLIQTQDIYTAVTQIGDAAGELSYVAVQGGIRASWSANTDIYLRFVATGGNLSTLTTGECTVYMIYQTY